MTAGLWLSFICVGSGQQLLLFVSCWLCLYLSGALSPFFCRLVSFIHLRLL